MLTWVSKHHFFKKDVDLGEQTEGKTVLYKLKTRICRFQGEYHSFLMTNQQQLDVSRMWTCLPWPALMFLPIRERTLKSPIKFNDREGGREKNPNTLISIWEKERLVVVNCTYYLNIAPKFYSLHSIFSPFKLFLYPKL